MGASTGGPSLIEKILASLENNFDATLIIAQHMGADFIPSFLKRLTLKSNVPVSMAQEGIALQNKKAYLTTAKSEVLYQNGHLLFSVKEFSHADYNPSINHLFSSCSKLPSSYRILCVLLTGIGDDGVDGCVELSQKGFACIAQNKESSIVFGMPARAAERVQNITMQSFDEILKTIIEFARESPC